MLARNTGYCFLEPAVFLRGITVFSWTSRCGLTLGAERSRDWKPPVLDYAHADAGS
jgi:hypothetical protein